MDAWDPSRCLFVDPKRCGGDKCANPQARMIGNRSCEGDLCSGGSENVVRLPEGSPCDGLLETPRSGGECVMQEPFCHMAAAVQCGTPSCILGASQALQVFKRAKAAEAAVADQRALLKHLAAQRQAAIDEQQSAKRAAAQAKAGLPELEGRVRDSVAVLAASHETFVASLPTEEARQAYRGRLAKSASEAEARLRSSVAAMQERAQGLQSAVALLDQQGSNANVQTALQRTGELAAQARETA